MEKNKDDDFGVLTRVAIVAALAFVSITWWNQNTPWSVITTDIATRSYDANNDNQDSKKVTTTWAGIVAVDTARDEVVEPEIEEDTVVAVDPQEPDRFTYFRNKGYTKIQTYREFAPNDMVTRGQWANYLAVYGKEKWLDTKFELSDCQFADIDQTEWDPAVDKMTQSCLLWLMRWSNGDFIPSRIMKTSEVLAVLVRSELWYLDETTDPRFLNYFEEAKNLNILWRNNDITNFEKNIDRKTFATWVYSLMSRRWE